MNIPAFPTDPSVAPEYDGMSLRDWFAGMAMQGMLADGTRLSHALFRHKEETGQGGDVLAKSVYMIADAMLAERAKERT